MNKIKQVASVSIGTARSTLRSKYFGVERKVLSVIGQREIARGVIDPTEIEELEVDTDEPFNTLAKGDILISKKRDHRALLINEIEDNFIADNSCFIIRILPDVDVLPEYLAWWLDQDIARSDIGHPNRENVKNARIRIPALSEQKTISNLRSVLEKKEALHLRSIELQKDLLKAIAMNIWNTGTAKGSKKNNPKPETSSPSP